MKSFTIKISDNEWTVHLVTIKDMPKKTWGDCNYDKRIIRVRKDLSRKNFLDTLIHEVRHAQHPVLFEAEHFIDTTSTEIAAAIIQAEDIYLT